MNAKTGMVVGLAGAIVAGCLFWVIRDSARSREAVAEIDVETRRYETALKHAREAARTEMRKRLKSEEKAAAASRGTEEAARRTAAKECRRRAVRRFFGTWGGVRSFSSAYMRACEMPKAAPTEADQEIIDLADVAASEEDLDTAADVAEAALASEDPRTRMAAVDMLTNLGDAGLLDISEFLSDPHPEVANLAADRWELGVQNVLDETERTALVKVGLLAITDQDQLRSMVGTLQLATDESLIVNAVIDVMRDGLAVQRDAVKDAYAFTTGEAWQDEATARKWLEENYTPPEPENPPEVPDVADKDEI